MQIEAESTDWTPWADGAYMHVGSEEVMFAARVTQVKVQTNLFLDSTGVTAYTPHLATSRLIPFKGAKRSRKAWAKGKNLLTPPLTSARIFQF